MEAERGWKIFESTGNVIDYLKYIACTEEKEKEGDKNIGYRSSESNGNCLELNPDGRL